MEPSIKILKAPISWDATGVAQALIDAISEVFIGKEHVVTKAALCLMAGGHVLLEDVPGVGKTLLAKALARSISADFKRIQFTADLLPSDISGSTIYSADREDFVFRKGPVFTNILLGDEINRATPRTQSSLLEAMEEQGVTVEGELHPLPTPFFVIATQNPVELEGTYPLPFAQMDRFMCRLGIGYMTRAAEVRMLKNQRLDNPIDSLRPVTDLETIGRLQQSVREVHVSDSIAEYIVNIVEATRQCDSIEHGASPRGSLDLQAFSQARALLKGREYVLPDDVKLSAGDVLSHRLIVRKGSRSVSSNSAGVIDQIIQSAPVPV